MKTKKNKNNESLRRFVYFFLTLAVIFLCVASLSYGDVVITGSPQCKTLVAGQHIDAGNVCVEINGDSLLVTYTTSNGWELLETHLWIGENLADMPQTSSGNPKIGNFPYKSGDIGGMTRYVFSIPLSFLGGADYNQVLCGKTFYVAAHAALQKPDGCGGYQTETGWADGKPIVDQGNWAMAFSFIFDCVEPPPSISCETAFAYGDKALWDVIGPDGNPITNRWGWEISIQAGQTLMKSLYAGAADNDITKGTYVGYVALSFTGRVLRVSYHILAPYFLSESHVYAGASEPVTAAPGLFGNTHEFPEDGSVSTDAFEISFDTCTCQIYVVAHARVCRFLEPIPLP